MVVGVVAVLCAGVALAFPPVGMPTVGDLPVKPKPKQEIKICARCKGTGSVTVTNWFTKKTTTQTCGKCNGKGHTGPDVINY